MKFINFKIQKIINDFLKVATFLLLGGLVYNNLRVNNFITLILLLLRPVVIVQQVKLNRK